MPGHWNTGLVYEMQPMLHSYFRPHATHIATHVHLHMDINIVFKNALHYTLPTSVCVCVRELAMCAFIGSTKLN